MQSLQVIQNCITELKKKNEREYTPEEITLIKNQNDFLRAEITKRNETISTLSKQATADFIPVDLFSEDKLQYVADGLRQAKIPFVEENTTLYIPSYAVETANAIAVVMTSSNKDPEEWRDVIGNKAHKNELAKKFKDNNSPLKIAIVVDMWLTGFDVPSLATMYVYKPMSGYNLMQAIARVNRVFRDKEGGLVVDYVGIATALKQAMNDYTVRDRKNYGDTDVGSSLRSRYIFSAARMW